MGVEIVHDEHDLLRLHIVLGEQFQQASRPSLSWCAACSPMPVALASKRLTGNEHVAGSFLLIGVVLAPGLTWLHVLWRMLVFHQILAHLIHTEQRAARVVGTTIDIQHIFHAPDKLGGGLGKAPLLFQPGLEFIFFSAWRTVSWLT